MSKLIMFGGFGIIFFAGLFYIKILVTGEFSYLTYYLSLMFGALFIIGVIKDAIKKEI